MRKMLFEGIKREKKTREKPAARSAGYTKGLCGCGFHLTQLHDDFPDQTAKRFCLISNKMNRIRQYVILVVQTERIDYGINTVILSNSKAVVPYITCKLQKREHLSLMHRIEAIPQINVMLP